MRVETCYNVRMEAEEIKEKDQKKMSWWRAYLFNRKAEKEFRREMSAEAGGDEDEKSETPAKDTRKLNQYLGAIESQLDKMDEQNQILLFHLSTVKENNEALLKQLTVLSKNNEQLFKQFQASKRREKVAKIIAIISSSLAVIYGAYRLIDLIIKLVNKG